MHLWIYTVARVPTLLFLSYRNAAPSHSSLTKGCSSSTGYQTDTYTNQAQLKAALTGPS